MNKSQVKLQKRARRHKKIRAKISGTEEMPRVSVFKSNKYIYAQIINDDAKVTLVSADSKKMKGKTFVLRAKEAGVELAKKAVEKNIKKVVFDRGGFLFTGVVKSLADGLREGGLKM